MRKPMNIDFERCNSGIEFEEWVKELLGQLRMKAERVVKNDCGIDIIAILSLLELVCSEITQKAYHPLRLLPKLYFHLN